WYWASSLIGGGTAVPPVTPTVLAGITPINQATPLPTPSPTAVALAPTPLPPTAVPTAVVNVTEAPPTAEAAVAASAPAGEADNPCANLPVYDPGTIVETTDAVNLRDGPTTDSNIVVLLQAGTRLQITGAYAEEGQCDWWPVTVVDTGQSGYVIEQYLKLSQQ
ncbi:MAG TPA: SH3 domain-containing protein, partial [Thermomicrobiales bacterium]|nr:SH3 domain-containing protein [Thermomicrobiales bacterium]